MSIYADMRMILSVLFNMTKMHNAFYKALIQRLARFGLEVAEDKTQIIEFSHCKAQLKRSLIFWGLSFGGVKSSAWKRKADSKAAHSREQTRAHWRISNHGLRNTVGYRKKYSLQN